MPARISIPRRGSARRRPAPARWHGRPGAGANGGSAALDGMQGRGAALDIAPRRAGVRAGRRGPACPERSAATRTISSRLPPETPDDIAPRLDQFARVRCRCRRAPQRRSCRDDRAGKAPGAPCRSASPHGRSCPPPGGFAVGQRGVGGHGEDRQPGEAPSARILRVASRPSISGICMSISTASNGARLQHLLNARQPAVGEATRAPSLLNNSAATWRFSALSSTTSRRTPRKPLGALHRARRRVGWGALFAVQRMQHRVGQLLGA